MTTQPSLFPDAASIDNPAADLPLVACGAGIPGRGCGAEIVWVSSERGKAVPLDPDPVPNGNLVFVDRANRSTVRYLRKGEVVPEGTARFVSHFATCAVADQFRRR